MPSTLMVRFKAKKEVKIALDELRVKYEKETNNPFATVGDAVEDLLRKNGLLAAKGIVV